MRHSLAQRLTVVFALLLIACSVASAWLQIRASDRYEQEVIQRLSRDLAGQIVRTSRLAGADGLDPEAVRNLFDQLMGVNPSVEVYLLAADGRIVGHAAPEGRLRRQAVDLAPIRRLLSGEPLPIMGDDPRGDPASKVFSAAQVTADGTDRGFVYVILQGEAQAALAADAAPSRVLAGALWSLLLVSVLGLAAGIAAFWLITRRLRRLTASVARLERDGLAALEPLAADPIDVVPRLDPSPNGAPAPVKPAVERDDIALLERTVAGMARRIAEQWQEKARADQSRREMVANISHDLRTPLTSLHGYLETLALKDAALDPAARRRYLDTALGQSRKVNRLAQDLFELATLEYGAITPEFENVDLADLLQDVFQKFELAAGTRRQALVARIDPGLPPVRADLGMIERVLTNLLDNAIRHTPPDGRIVVRLSRAADQVVVDVIDSGPGIPAELRAGLFVRRSRLASAAREDLRREPVEALGGRGRAGAGPDAAGADAGSGTGGGLGLLTVQCILRLHGSSIELVDGDEGGRLATSDADCARLRPGAAFRFRLPVADAGGVAAPANQPAQADGMNVLSS
jgi:signal transduction histidine kinase